MNLKKDFPIFENNKKLVYLDSAATSQKPQMVIEAITNYYENYNSNVRRGLYPIAEKATQKVEDVRRQVAHFIHAKDPSEIIFVRNTTEAINLVAYSLSYNIKSSDTFVTTILEHHSNFVPWQQMSKVSGSRFQVLDFNESFQIDFSKLDIKNTKVLTITHVSNVLGIINPIKEIIRKLRTMNSKLITIIDAAQSIPHMKIDVQDLDCDFLAFSGHKMFASTGIGVLYGKKKLLNEMAPFLFGGEMIKEVTVKKTTFADLPYKFEAGTPDMAGIISIGAAIEYINDTGIKNIQKHENELMAYGLSEMEKIEGLEILGSQNAKNRASVIAFTMKGSHPHDIAQILGDMGICIRSGHHCAMPLHKRLDLSASARISFSIYNDEKDLVTMINGLQKVKKIFRS